MSRRSVTRQLLNDIYCLTSRLRFHAVALFSVLGLMTGFLYIVLLASCSTPLETLESTQEASVVALVEVEPSSANVSVGGSVGLRALARDQTGNALDGISVAWSSSNASVATVDNNGLVTGQQAGHAIVVAESEGQSGNATITVTSAPPPPPPSGDLIPAFPGAEGHGATALNECRNLPLQVLFVTNTNGSGTGSFRQALADARSDRFTLIIFRTGGSTQGKHEINTSCVYIAGQTAPGGGFSINKPNGAGVLEVWYKDGDRLDIAVRHIRLRSAESETCGASTVRVLGGQRIIFDHVSIAYTCDSFIAFTPLTGRDSLTDVTLQNSVLCGALPKNGTAVEITVNDSDPPLRRLSITKNYVCHFKHRAPRFALEDTLGIQVPLEGEFISNLVYTGFGSRRGSTQGGVKVDFVNNLYRSFGSNDPDGSYLRHLDTSLSCDGPPLVPAGSIHMSNNRNATGNLRWDYDLYYMQCDPDTQTLIQSLRRNTPLPSPTFPVTPIAASDLPDRLLPEVGVSRLLACDGSWRMSGVRDALDTRFATDYLSGTGPTAQPSSTSEYGGYPTIDPGTPCLDSDMDGMPDQFENRYGLNPTDPSDNNDDPDSDGYLNIEEYVNGTAPR